MIHIEEGREDSTCPYFRYFRPQHVLAIDTVKEQRPIYKNIDFQLNEPDELRKYNLSLH